MSERNKVLNKPHESTGFNFYGDVDTSVSPKRFTNMIEGMSGIGWSSLCLFIFCILLIITMVLTLFGKK